MENFIFCAVYMITRLIPHPKSLHLETTKSWQQIDILQVRCSSSI